MPKESTLYLIIELEGECYINELLFFFITDNVKFTFDLP